MTYHIPVLLEEIIKNLNIQKGDVVLDATLGGGGYAEAILSRYSDLTKYIGIDQDKDALEHVKITNKDKRLELVHGNFSKFDEIIPKEDLKSINKIVFDLGISSYQIDTPERGFSYMQEGPLDMRMDQSSNNQTAADILNNADEDEIVDIIYQYGEEPKSRIIAREIIEYRKNNKFTDTVQLNEFLKEKVYGNYTRKMTAVKRVFQALRIHVNNELGILTDTMERMINILPSKGRIVVVTFHSLEDRIVKNVFNRFMSSADLQSVRKCNNKVVKPTAHEIAKNKRSKSAKLRAIEKI